MPNEDEALKHYANQVNLIPETLLFQNRVGGYSFGTSNQQIEFERKHQRNVDDAFAIGTAAQFGITQFKTPSKLKRLERGDGTIIFLNPDHVVSVVYGTDDQTKIATTNGVTYFVRGTAEDVAKQLEG